MAGTRSALLVAAYEFQDEKFRRLRAPYSDAEALAGVLGDDGIGGFDVRTLINEPFDVVTQEIEAFCNDRTPDDLLLLYFSCHGIKDATGRLYFAMANTRFDRLRSTGVSAAFVSEQMEYSRSRRIALLLDCCYSGAFVRGLRPRGGEEVQIKDHFEGRGRAVITASRATEYAFEADDLPVGDAQPSLFTGAVVNGLATGDADRDHDGIVTIDELYDYVYDEVRQKVSGQTPGRWVDLEGALVVARNPYTTAVVAEAAPDVVALLGHAPEPAPAAAAPSVEVQAGPAWLSAAMVAGAVLVLAAMFTPSIQGREALVGSPVHALGPAVAVALALTGAALLRGPGDRRIGDAVAAGVLPAALVYPPALAATILDDGSAVVAIGTPLLVAGCILLVVAGVGAVAALRRSVRQEMALGGSEVAVLVVAALLGAAGALVYGSHTSTDAAYGTGYTTLVWRLTLLYGAAVALRRWSVGARLVPARAIRPALVVLSALAIALFVGYYQLVKVEQEAVLALLSVVVVASAIIPLAALLMVPRHIGAVLLGAWALAQGAALAETPVHLIPYAALVALAVVLWRGPHTTPAGRTPS